MVDYTKLKASFEALGLSDKPVIAHASLKPFGLIHGGADTVLRAMLTTFSRVVMPAFTYNTMVTPEVGPPNNGITYGSEQDNNRRAEPFQVNMPPDTMMGILPRALLQHQTCTRSAHPILSFGGYNADELLMTQTLFDPLGPIGALAELDSWVVLINVDHTVNTSIHYAEKLAGRRQFVRWALLGDRVVECPSFPGDSSGFKQIEKYLRSDTRRVEVGRAFVQAVPLKRLLDVVQELIKNDPLALLCERTDCERCNAVRGY